HLLAALVDDAHRAVGRLDALAEVELHLVRRALQSALDAGLGALEDGMRGRTARGGHERSEREADTPRARSSAARQEAAAHRAVRLGESRLRLVVGDDVTRLQPIQIVDRARAAGGGDGSRSAVVAG